jgi:hypothetical protein
MKPLLDGLSVLEGNLLLVLGILSLIFLGQFLMYSMMKMIFGDRLREEEYYSLGMAGWILPVSLISLLWYLLGIMHVSQFTIQIIISPLIVVAVILFFRINKQTTHYSKATLLGLLLLFSISILLRLAFVSEVIFPLYFDSARHYTIMKYLLVNIEPSNTVVSFQWLTTDYYHIGFHFLAAFIASIMHVDLTKAMLILGPMILAVIPLSVFFIIKYETKSISAGIFAVLLAGFGWSMPAYAVNWGKYPAFTSLVLIQFVLGVAYLAIQRRDTLSKWKNWALYAILGLGILMSGFFHSRSLVIIGIAMLAWVTAKWWQNLPRLPRSLGFYLLIFGILLEIVFIQTQEILEPLFEPYSGKGLLITSIILFLFIFSQKTYPQLTFANILAIFLLLCSLFIPTVKIIPRFAHLTLLDRTFVQMILYLPLSFLGGLGLAGLEQTLTRNQASLGRLRILRGGTIGVLFSGLIIGNALMYYEFYPSDCCNIVTRNDLVAIDWIDENLPKDARILISSTELIVQSSGRLQGFFAADAGVWITPLTNRVTIPLPYDTNLSKRRKFNSLCKMGINYIYIGASGRSFHAPRLREHPDWYRPLLSMSRTEVYQVIGCN